MNKRSINPDPLVDSEYGLTRTVEELEYIAGEQGLVAFTPLPDELMLDIDKPFSSFNPKLLLDTLTSLNNGLQIDEVSRLVTRSKKGNTHIYIRLTEEVSNYQRMILQAAMGSDLKRELMGMMREVCGSECPTALFETKDQAKLVETWRKG